MIFNSQYGEAIARVLAAYPPGSQALINALEIIVKTAQDHVRTQARDEAAANVCVGLHIDPPSGLYCLSCYEAEQRFPVEMQVQAEIDAARKKGEGEER